MKHIERIVVATGGLVIAVASFGQMIPFNTTGPDYLFGPAPGPFGKVHIRNSAIANQIPLQVHGDVLSTSTTGQYGIVSQVNTNASGSNAVGSSHWGMFSEAKNAKTITLGVESKATLDKPGANAATEVTGILSKATSDQVLPSGFLRAYQGSATVLSGGNFSQAYGMETAVAATGATVGTAYGTYGGVKDGTITNAYGFYGTVYGAGTATNAYGGYGLTTKGATRYGLYGEATNAGTFTKLYGVFGKAPMLQAPPVLNWTLVTSWAGYFDGHVQVTGSFVSSDRKLKRDIRPLDHSLDLIRQFSPKRYYFDQGSYPSMSLPYEEQLGLIAQDVEKVLPNLVITAVHPEKLAEDGSILIPAVEFKTLNYIALIPVTIGAIQEQQAIIEEQKERINALTARLDKMDADRAATMQRVGADGGSKEITSLFQNEPNPFNENTVIRYQLPSTVRVAALEIFGANGQLVKRFESLASGQGQIMIAAGALKAGAYSYTLVVDGLRIDSKVMVITE